MRVGKDLESQVLAELKGANIRKERVSGPISLNIENLSMETERGFTYNLGDVFDFELPSRKRVGDLSIAEPGILRGGKTDYFGRTYRSLAMPLPSEYFTSRHRIQRKKKQDMLTNVLIGGLATGASLLLYAHGDFTQDAAGVVHGMALTGILRSLYLSAPNTYEYRPLLVLSKYDSGPNNGGHKPPEYQPSPIAAQA